MVNTSQLQCKHSLETCNLKSRQFDGSSMIRSHANSLLALTIHIALLLGIAPAARSDNSAREYTATFLPLPVGYVWSEAYDSFEAQQVGRGGGAATDNETHAILWNGNTSSLVDLHPDGYDYSFAGSVHGKNQVGWVGGPSSQHAALWQGTAESFVDLNPEGFSSSNAYGISETHQVGWAFRKDPHGDHAMIWNGTPESFVDLHPEHYLQSRAYEISGSFQVGYAINGRGEVHAALWGGSAESFVDLHPPGFNTSFARSVEGDYQVGSGRLSGGHQRALLWQGSENDVIHLHPPGFASSSASDVHGGTQVGFGRESYSGPQRALLWNGSADSYVDMHNYVLALDPRFQGSFAHDIEPNGDVFGFAWGDDIGKFAVKWTLIPEPGSQLLVLLATFTILSRRIYDASE